MESDLSVSGHRAVPLHTPTSDQEELTPAQLLASRVAESAQVLQQRSDFKTDVLRALADPTLGKAEADAIVQYYEKTAGALNTRFQQLSEEIHGLATGMGKALSNVVDPSRPLPLAFSSPIVRATALGDPAQTGQAMRTWGASVRADHAAKQRMASQIREELGALTPYTMEHMEMAPSFSAKWDLVQGFDAQTQRLIKDMPPDTRGEIRAEARDAHHLIMAQAFPESPRVGELLLELDNELSRKLDGQPLRESAKLNLMGEFVVRAEGLLGRSLNTEEMDYLQSKVESPLNRESLTFRAGVVRAQREMDALKGLKRRRSESLESLAPRERKRAIDEFRRMAKVSTRHISESMRQLHTRHPNLMRDYQDKLPDALQPPASPKAADRQVAAWVSELKSGR